MDKDTAIQSAQLQHLLSVSKVSLITSALLAVILAYMQREVIAFPALLFWCSLMVPALLLRAVTVIAYQRVPAANDAAVHVRLVRFRLGVLVAGVAWGLAGFLLFPVGQPQHQMFLIFTLMGMSAGGVISFSADLTSAVIFSVSLATPLMIRLFLAGGSLFGAMGVATMLYIGFMIMALRRINRAICENITLRLEADAREEMVRESEERFRLLLNHSPVGIFHYDRNFVVTYCNDHFADMLHNSIKRIIGLDMKLLNEKAILPALSKALEGGRGYYEGHYRATFSDANGWVAMTCAPSLRRDGRVIGGIAIVQDITERYQTEERLRSSLMQLEEKELAKTRFLAAAGHDLRQPVAAANLFVDALKFTSPDPQQSELIEKLDESMSVFSNMLERLLDISKFDAGLIKPQFTAFNLVELFNWLEQNFALPALGKQLRLRFFLSMSRPLVVYTDIGLLQSVLMNLVSNAIKFTARGGILVSARLRGDRVVLQVWDTGIGIAEANITHVFDEFYQVSNPQRSREGGLGLGLSICQRAMSLLGGKITCSSRIGHGTVFELSLPLDGGQDAIASLPGTSAPDAIANDMLFGGKRVVVVEDDALIATGMVSLLRGVGAEARHFPNAEEALRHEDINSADFFIVDYALGGELSGLEFLKAVQQRQQMPIRAVILTGETSSQFISSVADSPWPVLHKPLSYARLASSLRSFAA